MADEKALNMKIDELMLELENKDRDLYKALDRIEDLEDQLMRLEAMVGDEEEGKKGKKGKDSKILIELEEKEKEVRALKDKMGFLRKEKIQLQKELEKVAKQDSGSTVIRVPEKKTPLDSLVNELQSKINKQRLLITKLKQAGMSADAAELNEKLRNKGEEVETLKLEVEEMQERLRDAKGAAQAGAEATLTKGLTEELQNKLNKAKIQIDALKKKLATADKKGKKGKAVKADKASDALNEKIDELKEDVEKKNGEIMKLKSTISGLKQEGAAKAGAEGPPGPMGALTEELQNRLNKSKVQIKTLQDKLAQYEKGKAPASGESQGELEGELQMQKEMVISLQQQIEQQKSEVGAAKNEAIQHKLKCEDLENQVQLKEKQINDLKAQVQSIGSQAGGATGEVDPNVALRLRELKNMIEDLGKQNIQQRLEISQLRK
jgi:chromosome segregation ATPase